MRQSTEHQFHYKGLLYRALEPYWARQPLSGAGAERHGGRFNAPGTAALYTSLAPETALREANQIGPLQPTTLVSFTADLKPVFDATRATALAAYDLTPEDLADDLWRWRQHHRQPVPTQRLAEKLVADGYVGILVPSYAIGTQNTDKNMVLWRWGAKRPARLVLNDTEHRLGAAPG